MAKRQRAEEKATSSWMPSWRVVDTGSQDQLALRIGGGRYGVVMGSLFLAGSVVYAWLLFQLNLAVVHDIRVALQWRDYRTLILAFGAGSVLALLFVEMLVLGILRIFGRWTILLDRGTGTIVSQHAILSFPYFDREYRLENIESVSFGQSTGWRRVFQLYSLFLNRKDQRPVQLMQFPPKKKDQGRAIAGRVADFLALPIK